MYSECLFERGVRCSLGEVEVWMIYRVTENFQGNQIVCSNKWKCLLERKRVTYGLERMSNELESVVQKVNGQEPEESNKTVPVRV